MKKHCTSCNREIPLTSSICVFCGKRQSATGSLQIPEDPAKSTYQGVAVASGFSDPDPATVRRASLSAFTPTHEPNPNRKSPNFQLKDAEETQDQQDDQPVMTLPMTPAVQRPPSNPNQTPVASSKMYSTLPMTPVVQRPISETSNTTSPAKPASGMFSRQQSGMFNRSQGAPAQLETGHGTMLGLAVVRPPAQSKSTPAEEAPSALGGGTLHGLAQAVRRPSSPRIEVSPELSLEETRIPEAAATVVGHNTDLPDNTDLPELSPDEPVSGGTMLGRSVSRELLAKQLRAMDFSPPKVAPVPEEPVLPAPPGKVVARMDQPPGLTTDMVPMFEDDGVEETRPELMAPNKSHREELPTLMEPLPEAKAKKEPAPAIEPPAPQSIPEEPAPGPALLSMDAPISSNGGTAMLVKAALDIAEVRPETPEDPLPGSRGARVIGVVAGVLLLIAALLPVGPALTPAWVVVRNNTESMLLGVWGAIGLIALLASLLKLTPAVRGWVFAGAAAPALVLGALWGVAFFGELLAPAITEAAKGIAPAVRPVAPDTTFLENVSTLTPPWRVGLFIFGWTLLPAALFYRRFDTASIAARLMVTTGSAVVIANYLIPFEGSFLSALLAPVVGSVETASKILGEGPVALYSLVLHLLGTGDVIIVFFGVIFAIPIILSLLSFTAFFPGEQVSRGQDGAVRITTPVLSTGVAGLWASLFLLYLPVPMMVLGIVLCLDPAQRASGLVFLRFGLVVGVLPLLFSIGLGQALAARTFRRSA